MATNNLNALSFTLGELLAAVFFATLILISNLNEISVAFVTSTDEVLQHLPIRGWLGIIAESILGGVVLASCVSLAVASARSRYRAKSLEIQAGHLCILLMASVFAQRILASVVGLGFLHHDGFLFAVGITICGFGTFRSKFGIWWQAYFGILAISLFPLVYVSSTVYVLSLLVFSLAVWHDKKMDDVLHYRGCLIVPFAFAISWYQFWFGSY